MTRGKKAAGGGGRGRGGRGGGRGGTQTGAETDAAEALRQADLAVLADVVLGDERAAAAAPPKPAVPDKEIEAWTAMYNSKLYT